MAPRDEPDSQDRLRRPLLFPLEVLILILLVVPLGLRAADPPLSQTALSRLATVESLAHHGTWFIDRGPEQPVNAFEARTIDKVKASDRLISSKPPLMPLLMTYEYRALRAAFGWTLDNTPDTKRILTAYAWTFSILPWTIAIAAATRLIRASTRTTPQAVLLLLALAFGTQVFGFAAVLNNHVPAAALLLLAVCGMFIATEGSRGALLATVSAGFAAGTAAAFDVPNAIYVAGIGIVLAMHSKPVPCIAFALAATTPLVIQTGLLYNITGQWRPVQLLPDWYLFESSYWRNPIGFDAYTESKDRYAFHIFFGQRGVFTLYPVLLLGLAGAAMPSTRSRALRTAIRIGTLCFAVLACYYVFRTNNYGGEGYGVRWLIPSMPILILIGAPLYARIQSRVAYSVLGAAIVISIYGAWTCGHDPWTSGQEWFQGIYAR